MTTLFIGSYEKPEPHSRSNSTTGASYSVKRPASPLAPYADTYGGLRGLQTVRIIRIDPSCGYACFRGLFGLLVAFWGMFETVLQV